MNNENKSILMATSADANDWTMTTLEVYYNTLVKYLGFEDVGRIISTGCYVRMDIENSDYPKLAYLLVKSL